MSLDGVDGTALLAETAELSDQVNVALDNVLDDHDEFKKRLEDAIAAATERRTKAIFEDTLQSHKDLINAQKVLPDKGDPIVANFRKLDLGPRVKAVQAAIRETDLEKLKAEGDEHFLRCARVNASVMGALDEWARMMACARAPTFIVFLQHVRTVRAYLGKRSAVDALMDSARILTVALVKEGAGVLLPGIGLLEAAAKVFEPESDRKLAALRATSMTLDGLFKCEDSLRELNDLAARVGTALDAGAEWAEEARVSFEQDTDWLLGALQAARRS